MIAKLGRQFKIDARTFSTTSHVFSLLYGHAAHALSLSDICDALMVHEPEFLRVRGATPPARNTFSNANRTRDPAMAEALYWQMLDHLQRICPGFTQYGKHSGFIFRLKREICAMDSTVQNGTKSTSSTMFYAPAVRDTVAEQNVTVASNAGKTTLFGNFDSYTGARLYANAVTNLSSGSVALTTSSTLLNRTAVQNNTIFTDSGATATLLEDVKCVTTDGRTSEGTSIVNNRIRGGTTLASVINSESSVSFTTKGQVVIPVQLRRLYGIASGTRAVVKATPEGILLQPVTQALIESGCGMLPRTSKGSLKEERARYKMHEKEVEERRARRRS